MSDLANITVGFVCFALFAAGFFCVAHGLEGIGFLLMVASVCVGVLMARANR